MTCSLESYRSRIGMFVSRPQFKAHENPEFFQIYFKYYGYLFLKIGILLFMCLLCMSLVGPKIFSSEFEPCLSLTKLCYSLLKLHCDKEPLNAALGCCKVIWLCKRKLNKLAHIYYGNRGQRGKGFNCLYWNKGPSLLKNKQLDIETVIGQYKPHILGLGEANFHHDHELSEVQQADYTLHLDPSINNPNLQVARVVAYTHNSLRVKRRHDLEDDSLSYIWLECGLPYQKGIIV